MPEREAEADADAGADRDADTDADTEGEADSDAHAGHDSLAQNIDAIREFTEREAQKVPRPQRLLEHVSQFIGRPGFFAAIGVLVVAWMAANLALEASGRDAFDPPPFAWLQGLIALMSLLTANVVLIRQNRLARLADQRAHLDLKTSLLIERKVAKLIELVEELRRDLPDVRDRHDADAAALRRSMNRDEVLAALDEAPDAELGAREAPREAGPGGPSHAAVRVLSHGDPGQPGR